MFSVIVLPASGTMSSSKIYTSFAQTLYNILVKQMRRFCYDYEKNQRL
jgi:hypothetical protein